MNVFVLDEDPAKAAIQQCDRHVVKMIVESCQMLSTAHRVLDGVPTVRSSKSGKRMLPYFTLPDCRESLFYKPVHLRHPCTLWTMETSANYNWHWEHLSTLCKEYTHRYDKVHKSETLLQELKLLPENIPRANLTKWALAMGAAPECIGDDVVLSYRAFYQTKQKRFKMVWSRRNIPEWFKVV